MKQKTARCDRSPKAMIERLRTESATRHTPWTDFPKLDCSTSTRVSVPNGTSWERSRRQLSENVTFVIDRAWCGVTEH